MCPIPDRVDKTQATLFLPFGFSQGVGGSMAWNPSLSNQQKQKSLSEGREIGIDQINRTS